MNLLTTVPYCQESISKAECLNRTLADKGCILLIGAGIEKNGTYRVNSCLCVEQDFDEMK